MRKFLISGILVSLILVLILGGCAQQSPAPTQSVTKPPAATTVAKQTTEIMIAGGRVGDAWYVLSQALADFINRNSNWVRATVVATPGITGGYELAMKDPDKYLFIADCTNTVNMPKDPKFNNYDKTRFISICASIPIVFATYDEKIRKPQDLAGKKICVSRQGAVGLIDDMTLLEYYGLKDKVNLTYAGAGDAANALRDGLVDVGRVTVDLVYPNKWSKGSLVTELETRKPVYYLDWDYATVVKLSKEGKFASVPEKIGAGKLDPKTQPADIGIFDMTSFFAADERMNQDVVYEITKIIYQNAGKWGNWHIQGAHMTAEMIPTSPIDVKLVHPGAKKYYDENNIKVKSLIDVLAQAQ